MQGTRVEIRWAQSEADVRDAQALRYAIFAIEMGARLEDVGGIIHALPTLGEAVQESARRALGRAIHI